MQGVNYDSKKKGKAEDKKITPEQKTEIFSLFLMALSWGFGAPLHSTGRYLFS